MLLVLVQINPLPAIFIEPVLLFCRMIRSVACVWLSLSPFIDGLVVVCSMHVFANRVVCGADYPVRTRLRLLPSALQSQAR